MKTITEKIEQFLKEPRESECGGWAPVTGTDIDQLAEIIRALISAKWGGDADGDLPIEVRIVDRTVFQRMHYFPIPYQYKAEDEMAKQDILDRLSMNAQTAIGELSTHLKAARL